MGFVFWVGILSSRFDFLFSLSRIWHFFAFTDNSIFIGRTWHALDSYQSNPRMESKCTGLSSYGWRPNSRMKSDGTKAKNILQNLISKSSRHGSTNRMTLSLSCFLYYRDRIKTPFTSQPDIYAASFFATP